MKTRIAALGCASVLALVGCTLPATAPGPAAPTSAGSNLPDASVGPSAAPSTGPATPTAGGTRQPRQQPPSITLAGDAIAGRPLGTTPFVRVEPLIESRLGRAKAGRPELCRLDGERSPLVVVDHNWPGLTIHAGRRGSATVALSWRVDLSNIPDGFRLADRLPWQPTFASLQASEGVELSTRDGIRSARLENTAITYSGPDGARSPDTVAGGPGLACS